MTQASKDYDFLAKTIILGQSAVGKTSIWERYCENTFLSDYKCTIGVDFKVKTIKVSGKKVKLQIWDTAGQERFRSLNRHHYRGAHGVMLCYAVDNRESFEKIGLWIEEVEKYSTEENICFTLVGTKSDLSDQRVVSFDEGRQFADDRTMKFFETSAKTNFHVDEAFLSLAKDMCEVQSNKKDEKHTEIQLNFSEKNPPTQITCFKCL